jgi:hypothetical protein
MEIVNDGMLRKEGWPKGTIVTTSREYRLHTVMRFNCIVDEGIHHFFSFDEGRFSFAQVIDGGNRYEPIRYNVKPIPSGGGWRRYFEKMWSKGLCGIGIS